jgi:hypothetical protein
MRDVLMWTLRMRFGYACHLNVSHFIGPFVSFSRRKVLRFSQNYANEQISGVAYTPTALVANP